MKPLKVLLLSFLFLLMFNSFIYAASMIDVDEMIIPDDDNEILNYNLYLPSETLPPNQIKNLIEEMEEIEEEVCIYNIDLYNLNKYNLVSLENANIRCHVRGSIWIGGTLTGSQYVDDGSLNGESSSNSYIYENQSTIYFKSRTTQQSQDAYYKLAAQSVIDTTNYWKNILSILPKNSEYIKYVEPDANGYVDIRYWDYQCPGADTSISTIPILYWTDATKVDMGGLAGHLIAPFADIYITYCNHCGSIVGKTITTDGESHLNYWVPIIETEIETELVTETETELITETEVETETEPIIETELETETEPIIETETETKVETETELITETETESESESETELITESETELEETESETELITEIETEKITEIITESESESESERKKETESLTEKQTEKIIKKSTEKQTETETSGEVLGTSRNPKKIQPDEIYEPETNEKKKSKVNGVSRKTESVGLFENLKPISIPKTGDATPIKILIFIFSLSAIIIICIIFYKHHNKK